MTRSLAVLPGKGIREHNGQQRWWSPRLGHGAVLAASKPLQVRENRPKRSTEDNGQESEKKRSLHG